MLFPFHGLGTRGELFLVDQFPLAAILRGFGNTMIVLAHTLRQIRRVTRVFDDRWSSFAERRRNTIAENGAPGGLELPTFWFVARRSIQLSYGRTVNKYYHRPAPLIHPRPKSKFDNCLVRRGSRVGSRRNKLSSSQVLRTAGSVDADKTLAVRL